MTVVSNGQFWIYTLTLLIVWIIVLSTAFNYDSNTKNKVSSPNGKVEDELIHTGNCKSLCKHCGCLGFYCGEECICECNNDHSDTECINLIQINAQKLNIPFEVLIQGPSANTFVRNALQFEQNHERRSYGYRNKRSTVTVYKPRKGNQEFSLNQNAPKTKSSCEAKTLIKDIFKVGNRLGDRRKRSADQFNWFNDLRDNLLRPAPLGYKRKSEEPKTQTSAPKASTVSSIFDNSWFSVNSPNILTPAPLIKQKNSKQSTSDVYQGNDEDSSFEILNTETFHDDFADNHDMDLDDSNELKSSKFADKESILPAEKTLDDSAETLTSSLYTRLFNDDLRNTDDKDFFLPEEKKLEQSQESQTNGLYSRLFNTNFRKRKNKYAFLPEEESKETLTDDKDEFLSKEKRSRKSQKILKGGLYSSLLKDDLSKVEDKISEEEKKPEESQETVKGGFYSQLFKDDSSTPKMSLPKRNSKGLREFRIPWLKPVNLFKKFKHVIET